MSNVSKEQAKTYKELDKIIKIFTGSDCELRPHFLLTGASGTGKSYLIRLLAESNDIGFIEVNAAQLTKEGTAGNSLSKALTPLSAVQNKPVICFVDEFDKLFISGNSNSQLAHETTNGVQNEFLKVLESDEASVFGDYGKYFNIRVDKVLFIFAGAFNGEEDVNLDRLREMGVKTEFLGRVGLVFNVLPVTLDSMLAILQESPILTKYLKLFPKVDRGGAISCIAEVVRDSHKNNTLGVRMLNTLIHQYFIRGGKIGDDVRKASTFQTFLELD